MSADTSHKTVLSPREAAAEGYGGYSTLLRDIRNKTLPARKVGGIWKIARADLDARGTPTVPDATPFEDVETVIQRYLASAPPMSSLQRQRLRSLLGDAR